jgi:hypothetical protein
LFGHSRNQSTRNQISRNLELDGIFELIFFSHLTTALARSICQALTVSLLSNTIATNWGRFEWREEKEDVLWRVSPERPQKEVAESLIKDGGN